MVQAMFNGKHYKELEIIDKLQVTPVSISSSDTHPPLDLEVLDFCINCNTSIWNQIDKSQRKLINVSKLIDALNKHMTNCK